MVCERVDRPGEFLDAGDLVACDPDAPTGHQRQSLRDALLPDAQVQASGWDLKLGVEIVQVPAQVVDQRGALVHESFAMVGELANLQGLLIELRGDEAVDPLADRCARDRERIDWIGLPGFAGAFASAGDQLRRDPDHSLAAGEQEPLEPPGDVPAVLDRPHAFLTERSSPLEQPAVPVITRGHRSAVDLAAGESEPRRRYGSLVRVHPDHDHVVCPLRVVDR